MARLDPSVQPIPIIVPKWWVKKAADCGLLTPEERDGLIDGKTVCTEEFGSLAMSMHLPLSVEELQKVVPLAGRARKVLRENAGKGPRRCVKCRRVLPRGKRKYCVGANHACELVADTGDFNRKFDAGICLTPGCEKKARPMSRYCSNQHNIRGAQ